ncbi:hypothetical protein CKM354_001294000 [Cercospora kikuchii]|uniref:RxLR effector protein n=1 Tax=Cercospora kikuchii TaxID=84275 RepID=A0A9P3FMX2_9PEZI|nr:uncharacterized protein CKM354_001294000 [Cercospora kikuchii]GIZ49923.1 hypothetical protein CKM354_001294000 [Cercospora kikuchii]
MRYNVVLTAAVSLLGATVSAAPIGASLLDLSAQSFSKSLNSRGESNGPVVVDALDPEAKANYEFFKSYFDSEVNKRDADAEADADALRLINLPASLGVSTDEDGNLITREAEADPFWDTIKNLFSNWDGSRSGKRDAAPEPFWDTIKNLFSNWDGSRSGKRDAMPEPGFWDSFKNLFSNWDGSQSG